MAEIAFPFEDVDVSETQFGQWASNFQDYGVKGAPGDSNLLVSGDDSGMQVRVAAGEAFVRGHYYQNTTQATVTLAAVGGNTRIDAIVLELNLTTNKLVLKAVAGTAVLASPTPPALTQTTSGIYQMLLGYVTIPNDATSITAEMVTDLRTFMGKRIGIWTTATRPSNPTAQHTMGFNTTLGIHEVWNGTAWVSFAPDLPSQFLLMGA